MLYRAALSLLCACAASTMAFGQGIPSSHLPRMMFSPMPVIEPPVGLDMLFGPSANLEARIIAEINKARTEVLVNHYMLTNPKYADALARAFRRKCVVVVLLDSAPSVRQYEGFAMLKQRNIPFATIKLPNGGWNNSKYIIIDRQTVLTGTADLTRSSAKNEEMLFVLSEPSVVSAFYNHFASKIIQ